MAWLPSDILNELTNYTTGVWFRAKKVGHSGMILEDILISEPYKPTTVVSQWEGSVYILKEAAKYPFEIEGKWINVRLNLWEPKTITVRREGQKSVYYSPVVHAIFSRKILQAISDLFPQLVV